MMELEFDLYWLPPFNIWCNCSFDRYAYGLATLYIGESNDVFSYLGNTESWLILIPQPVLSVFKYYPKSPIWKCIPPNFFWSKLVHDRKCFSELWFVHYPEDIDTNSTAWDDITNYAIIYMTVYMDIGNSFGSCVVVFVHRSSFNKKCFVLYSRIDYM